MKRIFLGLGVAVLALLAIVPFLASAKTTTTTTTTTPPPASPFM